MRRLSAAGRILIMAWTAAAFVFAGMAAAEEVRIPVAFKEGQSFTIDMSTVQETVDHGAEGQARTISNPMISGRERFRVLSADENGFLIENTLVSMDVKGPPSNPREALTMNLIKSMGNALVDATARVRTDAEGLPVALENADEVKAHVNKMSTILLETLRKEMTAQNVPAETVQMLEGMVTSSLEQQFLSSDERLMEHITEGIARLAMPFGMTLNTDAPTIAGDVEKGEYVNGFASKVRVLSRNKAEKTLRVEWVQHYAPELLQGYVRNMVATLTQNMSDPEKVQAELAKISVWRVDTSTYDIDMTTGMPTLIVVKEKITVRHGEKVRKQITTKTADIKPAS